MRRDPWREFDRVLGIRVAPSAYQKGEYIGVREWDSYYQAKRPGFWQIPGQVLDYVFTIADRTPSVLDLGCGYGELITTLRERGVKRVSGMDFSHHAVLAAVAANPNNTIVEDDIETGTIGRHDIIFLSLVLPFLRDKQGVLRTLRQLAPLVVIVTPVIRSQTNVGSEHTGRFMRESELESLLRDERWESRILYCERRSSHVFNAVHLLKCGSHRPDSSLSGP